MPILRVLMLGGTSEASALSRALDGDARCHVTLSLAGRTRAPVLPREGRVRVGGFGGVDGLVRYLTDHRIDVAIDATHPFALQMSARAIQAAAVVACPLLRFTRPPWVAAPGDTWTTVENMTEAARALGARGRRVFLTVGRQDLAPFVAAPWHAYLIRSVDRPEQERVPPGAEVIAARGPFSLAAEIDLLRDRKIEVVVTKNSGGAATEGKLIAARHLGIPVVMVARPRVAVAEIDTVDTVEAALAWLARHHAAQATTGSRARPFRTIP